MKKNEILERAKTYFCFADTEYRLYGDTNKRREYIWNMIDYMNEYEKNGGKHLSLDIYKPLLELKKEYYEELIFTPTVEDLEEMKYWI